MLMRAGKITPSHFISSPKINILKKIDLFGKNLCFCHGNVSSATRRLVCDTLVTAVHNFFCQFTGTNHQSLIDTESSKYFRQCRIGKKINKSFTCLEQIWDLNQTCNNLLLVVFFQDVEVEEENVRESIKGVQYIPYTIWLLIVIFYRFLSWMRL